MHAADYPEVPDDFGHWLAGFIDGEGHFGIAHHSTWVGYRVYFAINLRDDDQPILDHCREVTGLGHLVHRQKLRPSRPGAQAQAEWHIVKKRDCQRLVELLDRYPLRAKKARDYAIWRHAVLLHAQMRNGRPPKGMSAPSWEPLARLREEIIATRAYQEPTTPTQAKSGPAG